VIEELDDFWHRKYGHDEDGRLVPIATAEEVAQQGDGRGVHLPSPSYWPIVAAFGLPIIAYGLIYSLWLCAVGGAVVVAGIYGWALEPPDAPGGAHGDHHEPDAGGELPADTDATAEGAPADDKEVETVG
jgi:cytochrome c oxidase subunit 1